jgi:galactokinase
LKLGEYVFLIIDSKEERFLPATDYNKRREECNLALEKISQISNRIFKSLSEIDSDLLQKLEGKLPANLFKRVRHIVNENNRVLKAKEYLKKGELESLGMLIKGSHESLRDDYEISTEKIDFLVNESITAGDVLGARVMGGGFGGSVIGWVRSSVVQTLTDKVAKSYYAKFKMIPNFLVCNSSHGVKTF